MKGDGDRQQAESTPSLLRQWGVVIALTTSLLGVPVAVVSEFEFGLLSALGVSGHLALGLLVTIPGLALGGLSLVAMAGS